MNPQSGHALRLARVFGNEGQGAGFGLAGDGPAIVRLDVEGRELRGYEDRVKGAYGRLRDVDSDPTGSYILECPKQTAMDRADRAETA